MKRLSICLASALAFGCTGCMSDRTKNMAETCQDLLGQAGQPSTKTFIQDAEAQLASLEKRPNKLEAYVRQLQDPDAMKYRPALQQCLWLLKSRQQ